MTHPARIAVDGFWFGPEVEGRHAAARLRTVFIARVLAEVDLVRALHEVEHVFIVEGFNDFEWLTEVVLPRLAPTVPVTVGREAHDLDSVFSSPCIDRVTVVARVWDKAALRLRPQDALSVGAKYDLLTFDVATGVRTVPSDYLEDKQ